MKPIFTSLQILQATIVGLLALTIVFYPLMPFLKSSIDFIIQSHDNFASQYAHYNLILFSLLWCFMLLIIVYLYKRPLPVLLLNYTCHKPGAEHRASFEICEYFGRKGCRFSEQSEAFIRYIYDRSGLGDETYGPPFIFQNDYEAKLQYALQEAEEGILPTVQSLLNKSNVDPSKITLIIVGCSMFYPAPSLTAMLVNHFKFSESVKTYNFAGMGCSAGTLAMDLAGKILRREVGYALIVVTESTSLNWYFGDNRHMLVTNCIFRTGTAATLLTSDPAQRENAKFELVKTLRTHHGADDAAYNSAIQTEDEEGNVGVALSKDLIRIAGDGLKKHITKLAPKVLPVMEMVRFGYKVAKSFILRDTKAVHVPDFLTAFKHICIHAGGKAVIDTMGRMLKFDEYVIEPARMVLHRFGNQSSGLVFYELAYFEAKGRIKTGDKVWMLAFGTGFKACSAVWRALKDSTLDPDNPWKDCIHRYPVELKRKDRVSLKTHK